MASLNPVLIDVPMPIRTPRLLIRPKQVGDGARTSAAVAETWDELHKWMGWAENRDAFTAEAIEIRTRHGKSISSRMPEDNCFDKAVCYVPGYGTRRSKPAPSKERRRVCGVAVGVKAEW